MLEDKDDPYILGEVQVGPPVAERPKTE